MASVIIKRFHKINCMGLLCLLLVFTLTAENGAPEKKVISQDYAQALGIDPQGNVIICGYGSGQNPDADFLTLKYDPNGELLWSVRYNGTGKTSDYARALTVDQQANVIVTGSSNGPGTSLDGVTVKYNSAGEMLWSARYDGPSSRDDNLESIVNDAAGNIYATGYSFGKGTEHDFITLKYDSQGRELWSQRYNPPRNRDDSACAAALSTAGGVLIAGTHRVKVTSYDYALLNYSSDGEQLWLAQYSGPESYIDLVRDMAVDEEGNIYLTGYGFAPKSSFDFVTVKFDQKGEQSWAVVYDPSLGRTDEAQALVVDQQGYIYVTGISRNRETGADFCTVKYDPSGQQLWAQIYNGPGNGGDAPFAIAADAAGGVYITGRSRGKETGYDYVILKYSSTGELLWEARYNSPDNGNDVAVALGLDNAENIYVTGYSRLKASGMDFVTIKYNSQGKTIWENRFDGFDSVRKEEKE